MFAAVAATTQTGPLTAGDAAHGDYRCADCGYGVAAAGMLPACPMCRGAIWLGVRRPFQGRGLEVTARHP